MIHHINTYPILAVLLNSRWGHILSLWLNSQDVLDKLANKAIKTSNLCEWVGFLLYLSEPHYFLYHLFLESLGTDLKPQVLKVFSCTKISVRLAPVCSLGVDFPNSYISYCSSWSQVGPVFVLLAYGLMLLPDLIICHLIYWYPCLWAILQQFILVEVYPKFAAASGESCWYWLRCPRSCWPASHTSSPWTIADLLYNWTPICPPWFDLSDSSLPSLLFPCGGGIPFWQNESFSLPSTY